MTLTVGELRIALNGLPDALPVWIEYDEGGLPCIGPAAGIDREATDFDNSPVFAVSSLVACEPE